MIGNRKVGGLPRPGSGLLALLVAAGAAACGDAGGGRSFAQEPNGACEPAVMVDQLPAVLLEASGVARDPRRADLFWAHNDSGNPGELVAIDGSGRLLGRAPVAGATDRDLEDLALGPCGDDSCLYLGDIGDNLAVHSSVLVHRLPLPELPEGPAAELPPVRPEASFRLVYPGGPRDAEALAVDAERGELVVVTKGREGVVELYVADVEGLRAGRAGPDTLRRVGSLPLPIGQSTSQFVTAADLAPDGARLAVRSYTTLYVFPWAGAATFDTAAAPAHSPLLGALEAQGEGLAWEASGGGLVLVSEGRGGRPPSISRISCPDPLRHRAAPGG